MRHVRMLGLCVVAVFAVGALATTSASALPEWGQCFVQPAHEGKYTDSNCTKKAKTVLKEGKKVPTGEFEFRKATGIAHKRFTGKSGSAVLTSAFYFCIRNNWKSEEICGGEEIPGDEAEASVECENETATGELAGTKEVNNVKVIFHGCHYNAVSCQNTVVEGEVQINELKGVLGYISKTKKEVGVQLNPVSKNAPVAKFECTEFNKITVGTGAIKEKWKNARGEEVEEPYYPTKGGGDGIISPITPVNQMTLTFTQVYADNGNSAEPQNVPSKFEGKPLEVLENWLTAGTPEHERSAWSPASEVLTNVNTGEEEVMIKA